MQARQHHQQEVQAFLSQHFGGAQWNFTIPTGTGNETYLAHAREQAYFVKLGVQVSRYQAMASLGLTPPVWADGFLADGSSIIVQPYLAGRKPSRKDFQIHLEQFATTLHKTHHSLEVQRVLPATASELYRLAGVEALARLKHRWDHHRAQVPAVAEFVDESLAYLAQQVQSFVGAGLAASHNDICNANWLVSPDGRVYLIDLESMTLDDPAVDLGAILWWYYPPALRPRFLEIAGCPKDEAFQFRMRMRMAMHCLNIILPREHSFDKFDPTTFDQALSDFRAILAGRENPQGYEA